MKTPAQLREAALRCHTKRIQRDLPIEDAKVETVVPKRKQTEKYRDWKLRYDRQYYKDNRVRILQKQAINRAKHPKAKRFCIDCGVKVGRYKRYCDKHRKRRAGAHGKSYYMEHSDERKAYQKAYREKT